MFCNEQIKTLRDAVKATEAFKTVLWGIVLPKGAVNIQWAADTLPACFFWGGNSEINTDLYEGGELHEDQIMSAYIFYYHIKDDDAYSDTQQSDGIEKLNELEEIVVKEILAQYNNLCYTGSIKIDRDTTLIRIGRIFNFLPPFYGSRIDFELAATASEINP